MESRQVVDIPPEALGFGNVVSEFKGIYFLQIAVVAALLILVALGCQQLLMVLSGQNFIDSLSSASAAAVFCVGAGAGLIHFRSEQVHRVLIFEKGLWANVGFRTFSYQWNQIKKVHMRVTRLILVGTETIIMTIEFTTGDWVELKSQYVEGLHEMFETFKKYGS